MDDFELDPVGERDDFDDDFGQTDQPFEPSEETSFTLPKVPDEQSELQNAENTASMNDFYEFQKQRWDVNVNAPLNHFAIFEKDPSTGQLFIKYGDKMIRLTNAKNPNEFLSLSTIQKNYGSGGVAFVRDVLGIRNYSSGAKPKIPPEQRQTLNEISTQVAAATGSPDLPEQIEMQAVQRVEDGINKFLEEGTQTELALGPEGSLPFRELAGLDRSLRNMRTAVNHLIGEREANKARMRELKAGASTEETRREIETLEEKVKLLDGEIREYDGKFRSQFERIKQTIDKMLNEDMTLGERVRTLFREQGITIVSVITAIGMAIGTLISSIIAGIRGAASAVQPGPTPDPKPGPKPGPKPRPKPDIKGWTKEQLKNIAKLLLKLGDKMLVALPGIIGSVLNFVLKTASAAVGFLAEHLWLLLIAIGGILYNYVISLQSPKRSRPKKR